MRTLSEVLRIVLGVIGTLVIASLAAWAVPNAYASIWGVAWVSAAVVASWGIRPLRAAWALDRERPADGDAATDA